MYDTHRCNISELLSVGKVYCEGSGLHSAFFYKVPQKFARQPPLVDILIKAKGCVGSGSQMSWIWALCVA